MSGGGGGGVEGLRRDAKRGVAKREGRGTGQRFDLHGTEFQGRKTQNLLRVSLPA